VIGKNTYMSCGMEIGVNMLCGGHVINVEKYLKRIAVWTYPRSMGQLSDKRVRGEWFDLSYEDLTFIAGLARLV
jgi:hypothetical protein